MKEDWSKKLDFLNEESATLTQTTIAENDDLLMAILFSEKSKVKTFNFDFQKIPKVSSTLAFLHVAKEGESTTIVPDMQEGLTVTNYNFHYYIEQKALVGIFSITQVVNEKKDFHSGIGYAYMAWDVNGNLLRSKNQFLKFEDLDGIELKKRLEVKTIYNNVNNALGTGKVVPAINMNNNFETFFQKDGIVLIGHKDFSPKLIGEPQHGVIYFGSNLIYKVSNKGELEWTKFFARDEDILC